MNEQSRENVNIRFDLIQFDSIIDLLENEVSLKKDCAV